MLILLPKTMRRNNQKKMNKKKNNQSTFLLKKTISTNTSSVVIDCIVTIPLFVLTGTNNLSTSNSSDLRYYSFVSIVAGSTFSDFALVYDTFRINSASAVVTPYSNFTQSIPPMHLTCDPDGLSSNPTNATVVNSQQGYDFNINAISPKAVKFVFPGVGSATRLWLDVATAPAGTFYFGINTTNIGSLTTEIAFEASFMLNLSFRGVRGN
jgi:hypothetical protein